MGRHRWRAPRDDDDAAVLDMDRKLNGQATAAHRQVVVACVSLLPAGQVLLTRLMRSQSLRAGG
jgi:hypothetical protein